MPLFEHVGKHVYLTEAEERVHPGPPGSLSPQ